MRFMLTVRVEIPPARDAEAKALLPAERAHVEEHLRDGILEAIYFEAATPVTQIWAVMRAESEEEARRLVAGYPLHEFFKSVTYTALQ